MNEGQAIAKLVAEFGAEVGVRIHGAMKTDIDVMEQRRVNMAVRKAGGEWLDFARNFCKVAVIWPTPADHGRSPVARALISAGIWGNNVAHFPMVMDDQPVTVETMAYWRPYLQRAITAAGTKYLITIGPRTLWFWRPDLALRDVEGKAFIHRSRHVILPMADPVNLDKYEVAEWRTKFANMCKVIRDNQDIDALDTQCVKRGCSAGVYYYDPDGVAWCKEHVMEGAKAQAKGVKKWGLLESQSSQQTML